MYSEEEDTVTLKEMNLVVRNHIQEEESLTTENPDESAKKLYFWQNEAFTKSEISDIKQYQLNQFKINKFTKYPYTDEIYKNHKDKGKRFISKLAIDCYVTFIGFKP